MERWFRSFQEAFVPELNARTTLPTLVELNRFLWAWIEQHYHLSEHRELQSTPAKRWAQDPTPLRHIDPITLEGAFLLHVERMVDKTGLIRLFGRRYLADKALAGQRIEVRYHPQDLEQVQIWLRDQFLQLAFPYEIPTDSPRAQKKDSSSSLRPTTSYLDQLHSQREQQLAKERENIRSRPPEPSSRFRESDFLQLLVDTLGCALTEQEESLARRTWRRCGGLDLNTTQTSLHRAIAQWGKRRHPSIYLDAIVRAHQRPQPPEVKDGV